MTDDARWIAALRSSHDRFAGLVEGLSADQVTGPSYDDEWTIADVASHLGSQAEIFEPFLDAGLTGGPAPANDTFPPIWDRWNAMAPADQVRESVERNEAFVQRLEGLSADERSAFRVPLFGSDQDLAGFASMRLGEHAVHTWDVAVAFDPAATVSADAVDLLVDGIDARLGWVGKPVDGGPTGGRRDHLPRSAVPPRAAARRQPAAGRPVQLPTGGRRDPARRGVPPARLRPARPRAHPGAAGRRRHRRHLASGLPRLLSPLAARAQAARQRMFPVWPNEIRPGCGHTSRPCGPALTGIVLIVSPVLVSMT